MKVLLDANILFHSSLRSLFIFLHSQAFLQVHLSLRIIDEWKINFAKLYKDSDFVAIFTEVDDFTAKYPNVIVSDYEDLATDVKLFDKNDHHLLQAAIKCEAQYIITYNIKDFPKSKLRPLGIEAITPKVFFEKIKEKPQLESIGRAYSQLFINGDEEREYFKKLDIRFVGG